MKLKKTLAKLEKYFNADTKKLLEKEKSIKLLLKKLKHKQQTLQKKLEHETDVDTINLIEYKIKIIKRQREKGLQLLRHPENVSNDLIQVEKEK